MIKLKVKPVSTNSAYYRYKKSLNATAREYRESFMQQLQTSSSQFILKDIQSKFNKKKHSLSVSVNIQIPRKIILTKAGYLSRKGGDIDNYQKLLLDFLTNERYNKRLFLCGICYNLNIDDQFISILTSKKSVSTDASWYILIDIKVIDLPS